MVVVPVAGVTGTEEFDWCGHQDISLWYSNSDIPGYHTMDHVPEKSIQYTITSPAVTSASGEQTLGVWLSPPFTHTTKIAPGRWIFRMYAIASSDAGTTSMHYRLFNRSSSGVITYLFFGNAISRDITSGTIPTEYNTYYARKNATTLFPGDRLGISVNVSTNNAAPRTVTLEVAGNMNASYVSSGYWVCDDSLVQTSCQQNSNSSGTEGVAIMFGLVGGIIGSMIIIRSLKK